MGITESSVEENSQVSWPEHLERCSYLSGMGSLWEDA